MNGETVRPLTYGEQLVGVTFNPSADDKVAKAKALFAEIADLVNDQVGMTPEDEATALQRTLFPHTIGEILNAQMNVVKLLTLKY